MKKVEVLKCLENVGVIVVLWVDFKEEVLKISYVVVEGGMIGLELIFIVF